MPSISASSRLSLTLVLLALPVSARAQTAGRSVHPTAAPVVAAARRDGAIAVDGRLDDAAWQQARPITELRQFEPDEGAPASLPTEIRILYDDQAIYIGARMGEPGGVAAPLARRDQLLDSNGNNGAFNSLTTDKLIVDLDPYHNHLDDVLFEVNPAGVKGDQLNGDPSWDPIWEAAAQADSAGWTAEMRIPFSQLRFSRDSVQNWGIQVWRGDAGREYRLIDLDQGYPGSLKRPGFGKQGGGDIGYQLLLVAVHRRADMEPVGER